MTPSTTLVKAQERTEATVVYRTADVDGVDSPAYQCSAYREQMPDVDLMVETYGGTKTMRAQGKKLLPQHPMEADAKYKARVAQAVAFNAVRKTIEGLSGMIFRRDPVVSADMPEVVAAHLENVDLRGNNLAVFLHRLSDLALRDGHAWVHVESPPADGFRNAAESERAGVRPYWITIKKQQAHNYRWTIRGGRPVLTLFAYREGHVEAAGAFGEERRERIRVLREGTVDAETGVRGAVTGEVWELREVADAQGNRKPQWVRVEWYETGVAEIPVVFVASEAEGEFQSRPPLLDLAYEQIEHYRVRSDRQKSLTFASIAVPYVFGREVTDQEGNAKVKWGADGMLLLNDPEAKAGMLESQGFGLDATQAELQAIQQNMAALGLRMLLRKSSPQPTTATADILEKSESNASLATFATALEDAVNLALIYHAAYRTDVQTPGTVAVNRDFHEQLVSPQMIQVLSGLVGEGRLSQETMWAMLIEGEVLPEDFDPEIERARIAQDGAAGLRELFGEAVGGPDEQAPAGAGQ